VKLWSSNKDRAHGVVVMFNSRREDAHVEPVYGQVVGRAAFGAEWCSSPQLSFKRASIHDAAMSPRAWESSTLLSDPMGDMNLDMGEHVDEDRTDFEHSAPWVVGQGTEWVPCSPLSPRKLHMQQRNEASPSKGSPKKMLQHALRNAERAQALEELGQELEEREEMEESGMSMSPLWRDMQKAAYQPSSSPAVEALIEEALEYADIVYVALSCHAPSEHSPIRGYTPFTFPQFLQKLARGDDAGDDGANWDHAHLPSMVLFLVDSERESYQGFTEDNGWSPDTALPLMQGAWLWRLRNPAMRNVAVVIAKATPPTASAFMHWGIRSQIRAHQRFYFADFSPGARNHGHLLGHAAALRFGTETSDSEEELATATKFWNELMYDTNHSRGIQLVQAIDKNFSDEIDAGEVMVLGPRHMSLLSSVYSRSYGNNYSVTHDELAHHGMGIDVRAYRESKRVEDQIDLDVKIAREISLGIYERKLLKEHGGAAPVAEAQAVAPVSLDTRTDEEKARDLEAAFAKRQERAAGGVQKGAGLQDDGGLGLFQPDPEED